MVRGSIDKVEFGTAANRGPLVSATVSYGVKSLTPEEAKLCEEMLGGEKPFQMDIFPATKSYRLEFFFDGRNFEPTPESAATLHLLFP